VVAGRRALAGRWLVFPDRLFNGAWQSATRTPMPATARQRASAGAWSERVQRALPMLAIAGLLAIAFAGDFRSDAPPLSIDRSEAERLADAALKGRGITLGKEWRRSAATRLAPDESSSWLWHKFAWREAGHEAYHKLIGTWLAPPVWEVRYARFETGNVAERAEEWRITIAGD